MRVVLDWYRRIFSIEFKPQKLEQQIVLVKIASLYLLLCSSFVLAESQTADQLKTEAARIYRNSEERRESGLGTQVTDWLKVSGLIEIENEYLNNNFSNDIEVSRHDNPNLSLQVGLQIDATDWFSAEILFDAEYNAKVYFSRFEEILVKVENEQWEIKIGRLFLPFGEYYSHFVTSPILEFGETRANALVLEYSPLEDFEITGFILESRAEKVGGEDDFDWGLGLRYSTDDPTIQMGAGFLSDLAESEERLLQSFQDTFKRRVSAWNAYARVGFDTFEITGELVQATRAFKEIKKNSDKPFSYNIEFAYFPKETLQLSVRTEHSDELADQPSWRFGISGTWRPITRFNLSVDYLYGKFKNGFIRDDSGNTLNYRHLIAAQLALEF